MREKVLAAILAVAVTLSVAVSTATFWWRILSEDSPAVEDGVAPKAVTVPRPTESTAGRSASSPISEISYSTSNPLFHVEPYLQYPTPTCMSILWETTNPLPGEVEYGETEALGRKVIENGAPRTLHEVRLSGLKPGTLYYYRVRSGEAVSPVYSFRTAPPEGTGRWRLAVYGDSRSNPAVHRAIVEQIARKQVDLIVHTGDMVLSGKNHGQWAREFFGPLTPLACRVPIIAVPGNHEGDSPYYFQYFALPGNERYYLFRYANARFVCLDSNVQSSSESDRPDSSGAGADQASRGSARKASWADQQLAWLQEQLQQLDDSTWNFVVCHQPLFSAHATRPISPLRWQWTPLLLDPKHPVDMVLSGHDHFYARTWPIASYSDSPTRGVIFLTSAGGGAPLYRTRPRSYIATAVPVHHFTLLDFHDDEVSVAAYTASGQALDRFVVRKRSSATEYFCWESELLRENMRRALSEMSVLTVTGERATLQGTLEVANPFRRPIRIHGRWTIPPGWRLSAPEFTRTITGQEPLRIPLEAQVHAEAVHLLPRLHLELLPVQPEAAPATNGASDLGEAANASAGLPFRNRSLAVYPFKLAGPDAYTVAGVSGIHVDGQGDDAGWQQASVVRLPRLGFGSAGSASSIQGWFPPVLGSIPGTGPRLPLRSGESPPSTAAELSPWPVAESPPEVRLAANDHQLFVLVQVRDGQRRIAVQPPDSSRQSSALVLYDNHVRVELFDGKRIFTYALSAENVPYHCVDGRMEEAAWLGVTNHDGRVWTTELGIPLPRSSRQAPWRCNVVMYLKEGSVQYEWRPDRPALPDTESLPVWDLRGPSRARNFARLLWP